VLGDSRRQQLGAGAIPVAIIAANRQPRNQNLVTDLEALGHPVEVFDAINLRTKSVANRVPLVAEGQITALLGRTMTDGELGCAASHLACQHASARASAAWTVIMEDDAGLEASFRCVPELLTHLVSDAPRVVTFLSNPWIPLRRRSVKQLPLYSCAIPITVAKYYRPPHRAIAYALNPAARQLAASQTAIMGLADWPPWAVQCEFWAVYPWPVRDVEAASLIDPSGLDRKQGTSAPSSFLSSVRIRLDYLAPTQARAWRKSLGGWTPYARYVVAPRLVELMRWPLQARIRPDPDSPIAR